MTGSPSLKMKIVMSKRTPIAEKARRVSTLSMIFSFILGGFLPNLLFPGFADPPGLK
jgi:hypothetical protein